MSGSNLPTQEYLDDLRAQRESLLRETADLQRRIDSALIEYWDISPGDLVRNTGRRRTWETGRVASVRPPYDLSTPDRERGRPWVMVYPQIKGGAFRKSERHAFSDWEKVPAFPPSQEPQNSAAPKTNIDERDEHG